MKTLEQLAQVYTNHSKYTDDHGVAICVTCTITEYRKVGGQIVWMYWGEGDCPGREIAACERCNYDRHVCPGCGTPVSHKGSQVCDACTADYEEELRGVYET